MNLRQATKMNSYTRNHCGLHVLTSCIWSYDRHENIIHALPYNHAHTTIQSYTYNHAMVLHAGKMNQGPGKCSRCLLGCWCVHSIPFLQVKELLIDLGQATNMNWYRHNHVGWHAVTECIWSYDRHHDIMRTLVIQSYTYNHTHTSVHIQSFNDVAHGYVTHSHEK